MEKKYFLIINNKKVYVSEEVYKIYWEETNRERYHKNRDRENRLLLFSSLDNDGHFVENIEDKSVDVEKLVETKYRIEELHDALSKLNEEERCIIKRLYFDDESMREVAKELNVSHQSIYRKKNKILAELKKILEKL